MLTVLTQTPRPSDSGVGNGDVDRLELPDGKPQRDGLVVEAPSPGGRPFQELRDTAVDLIINRCANMIGAL
jgi:hypothetical protein